MIPKLTVLIAAWFAILFFAGNAVAISDYDIKDPTKLEGIVYATKWTCPKADKPCAAYFELHGKSAKRMYDNMRAPTAEDICTGGKMKTDRSGLHCFHSAEGNYSCYFGYDFEKRRKVIIPVEERRAKKYFLNPDVSVVLLLKGLRMEMFAPVFAPPVLLCAPSKTGGGGTFSDAKWRSSAQSSLTFVAGLCLKKLCDSCDDCEFLSRRLRGPVPSVPGCPLKA